MSQIMTVLEARVDDDRQEDLRAAYRAAAGEERPAGFLRSMLLQSPADPTLWRIETLWESREQLVAMRAAGVPPRGILIFRAAGAEPTTGIFAVAEEIDASRDAR
jgi:antibiotic biosynthesis monooxygenase